MPSFRLLRHRVLPIVTASFLAAIQFATPNARCQTAPATSDANPVRLTSESNLVVVRVVVRDGHGTPVAGLKREDFKLFDRGKEQQLSQFEEEPSTEESISKSPASQTSGDSAATAPDKADAPRLAHLVAFFFDNLDARPASLMQARDAADRFLSTSLQPGDRVAIFSSEKLLTDFTSDPAKIHEALAGLNSRSQTQQAVRQCPDLSEYQASEILESTDLHSSAWQLAAAEIKQCSGNPDPNAPVDGRQIEIIRQMARRIVDEAAARTRSNLEQFDQVTKYMSKLTGERTIVLVSPGFLSQSEQYRLDRIIDRTLRSQVVINALDPKGLALSMRILDASRATISSDQRAISASYKLDAAQQFQSGDVLVELSQGTGGSFFHNDNDLAAGFSALAGHPDDYILAFSPKDIKQDGKFHEIKVALASKPKGYTVLARRGYFAIKDADDKAAPLQAASSGPNPAPSPTPAPIASTQPAPSNPKNQMNDQIREALQSTTDSTQLPIGIDLQQRTGQGNTRELSLLIHLQTETLPLRKEADRNLETVTFAAAVLDQSGKVLLAKQRAVKIDMTAEQVAEMTKDGLEVTMSLPLQAAGAYTVRAVVTESEEHKLAALSKRIEVP